MGAIVTTVLVIQMFGSSGEIIDTQYEPQMGPAICVAAAGISQGMYGSIQKLTYGEQSGAKAFCLTSADGFDLVIVATITARDSGKTYEKTYPAISSNYQECLAFDVAAARASIIRNMTDIDWSATSLSATCEYRANGPVQTINIDEHGEIEHSN